jgi:hypothetical protein
MTKQEWDKLWGGRQIITGGDTLNHPKEKKLKSFSCECGHSCWDHNSLTQNCIVDRLNRDYEACPCVNVTLEDPLSKLVREMRSEVRNDD